MTFNLKLKKYANVASKSNNQKAKTGSGSGSVSQSYHSVPKMSRIRNFCLENEVIIVFVSSRAELRRAENAAGTTAPASESQLPSPQASPHRNVSAECMD
jgi:hypothetical protein